MKVAPFLKVRGEAPGTKFHFVPSKSQSFCKARKNRALGLRPYNRILNIKTIKIKNSAIKSIAPLLFVQIILFIYTKCKFWFIMFIKYKREAKILQK